jgi:hypothetical protein
MNTITATQDEVRELESTGWVVLWREVRWVDANGDPAPCPYGEPGDVLVCFISHDGFGLAESGPISTITSVEVRERDGKWWWVVAADARNSQESSDSSTQQQAVKGADDE